MPSAENEPRSSAADLPIQHCRRITTRPTKGWPAQTVPTKSRHGHTLIARASAGCELRV